MCVTSKGQDSEQSACGRVGLSQCPLMPWMDAWRGAGGGGLLGAEPGVPELAQPRNRLAPGVFVPLCSVLSVEALFFSFIGHHSWEVAPGSGRACPALPLLRAHTDASGGVGIIWTRRAKQNPRSPVAFVTSP